METEIAITSEDILNSFGTTSNSFKKIIAFLEGLCETDNAIYFEKYQKWKDFFKSIYGKEVRPSLFLKHTYLVEILKSFLIIKYYSSEANNLEEIYKKYKESDLVSFSISEYSSFFNWVVLSKEIFSDIFEFFNNCKFEFQDLFSELYQQIFFVITRHKIGEFYTPTQLADNMIENSYTFGKKVLDPSCGSGTFILQIYKHIVNSNRKRKDQFKALSNIYGFEINPVAIIVAKINILLNILEHFGTENHLQDFINIYMLDSLFPEEYEESLSINLADLSGSFDLLIGNPPWLTYKDLVKKDYQTKILNLSKTLSIKPKSQFITHIELASVFFYATTIKFLKIKGTIFFILTKGVITGDHCLKFRAFTFFDNIEIWDFKDYCIFPIQHICLRAQYVGRKHNKPISKKYPIQAKIFDKNLVCVKKILYSSIEILEDGAKSILPINELISIQKLLKSKYRSKFFQGATLVPRSLVFFNILEEKNTHLVIRSDSDVLKRAKKKWYYKFDKEEIEKIYAFKTFLNQDLIPFHLKTKRDVFLPVQKEDFEFDLAHLKNSPLAYNFYNKTNEYYKKHKKITSSLDTLISNLNYWSKLTKQSKNSTYLVVYNASGSNLKSSVIENESNSIIIDSENYYYSTPDVKEAYYLCSVLNSPILTRNIKLVKSSRHIHKRPFIFPIPLFDAKNEDHLKLAKKAKKCEALVQDWCLKNPKITSKKIRTLLHHKLLKIDDVVKRTVFNMSEE